MPLVSIALGVMLACGAPPTSPSVSIPIPDHVPPDPPPPPPVPPAPRVRFTKFLAFGDSLTEGQATPLARPMDLHTPCGATASECVERSYPAKLLERLSARYTDQTILVYNDGIGGRLAKTISSRGVSSTSSLRSTLRSSS